MGNWLIDGIADLDAKYPGVAREITALTAERDEWEQQTHVWEAEANRAVAERDAAVEAMRSRCEGIAGNACAHDNSEQSNMAKAIADAIAALKDPKP